MTIEEQLKGLMISKSGSINKFASDCGLPYSTIATMLRRGINNTNINTIICVCQSLNISVDELASGKITYLPSVEYPIIQIEKLTDENKQRLLAYYQALIDTQEGQ